jgi:superoxide dismutase, Fe-Mn family
METSIKVGRRTFVKTLGVVGTVSALQGCVIRPEMEFDENVRAMMKGGVWDLPPLPYGANSLAPIIDEQTMRLHHDKHHATYVEKVKAAIAAYPEVSEKKPGEVLADLESVPEPIRMVIRNHGGGHYNHSLFWRSFTPGGSELTAGGLSKSIISEFGSLEIFKATFVDKGAQHFGSGWVWLVADKAGKLSIITTPNQDTPLAQGLTPVFGNDLWEHAYYLKYQNKRADYLKACWSIVDWDLLSRRYDASIAAPSEVQS